MRNLRRLGSTFLALVMCLALSVPAFAAEGDVTLTIENAKPGATYNVYKLADVTISEAGDAYSYQSTAAWAGFWKAAQYDGLTVGEGDLPYFVWEDGTADANIGATIADAAKVYATDNSVAADKTIDVPADNTAKNITDTLSGDGYYMVLSSLGFVSMLDTAQGGELTISEKNLTPSIIQFIKDWDRDGNKRLYNSTASFDEPRTICTVIEVPSKLSGLKASFDLDAGLTFDGLVDFKPEGTAVEDGAKLVGVMKKGSCTEHADHMYGCVDTDGYPKPLVYESTSGYEPQDELFTVARTTNGFDITFTDKFLNHVDANEKVLVEYRVKVNNSAAVSYPSVDGLPADTNAGPRPNTSVVTLYYGEDENIRGNDSEVALFTLALPVYKFANEDQADPLADAKFSMKWNRAGVNYTGSVYFKEISAGSDTEPARYTARHASKLPNGYVESVTTPASGRVFIEGVYGCDKATDYVISEDEAPAGYNKLDDTKTVAFNTADVVVDYFPEKGGEMPTQASTTLDTTFSMKNTSATDDADTGLDVVVISNVSGTKMPETGGSGVTLILLSGVALLAMTGIGYAVSRKKED